MLREIELHKYKNCKLVSATSPRLHGVSNICSKLPAQVSRIEHRFMTKLSRDLKNDFHLPEVT